MICIICDQAIPAGQAIHPECLQTPSEPKWEPDLNTIDRVAADAAHQLYLNNGWEQLSATEFRDDLPGVDKFIKLAEKWALTIHQNPEELEEALKCEMRNGESRAHALAVLMYG